jgi:hypothetical protein
MISCRYINNEVEDIECLVNYLNNPYNDIKTDDEALEVVMYLFNNYLAEIDNEETDNLVDENIEAVTYKLVKLLLEVLEEIRYSKLNNENIDKHILEEVLKIKRLKEKEYISQEELELIFGLKKDKVLELRTKKELKYFQMGDKEKVLFKLEDVRKFMNKYTK